VLVAVFATREVIVSVIVDTFRVVVLPMDVVSTTVTMEVTAGIVVVDSLVATDVIVAVMVEALSETVWVVISVMMSVATGRVTVTVLDI
jgi:hypothetical protein